MITSYQRYQSKRIWLGYSSQSGPCACNDIWYIQAGSNSNISGQHYYIDSQDVSNDIRFVTSLYSNEQMNQLAPAGYYAQVIPEQVSGSQYWWVYWNGTSISQLTQADEGNLHGLFRYISGSTSATCSISHHGVYFPSGQTFATATSIYADPFGCSLAPYGRWFNPIGSGPLSGALAGRTLTRYMYSNGAMYGSPLPSFHINTGQWVYGVLGGFDTTYFAASNGAMSVNYGVDPVDSVCNPIIMDVWQTCSSGSISINKPLLTYTESSTEVVHSYAPSGYYHFPVNAADFSTNYWNGETGTWYGLMLPYDGIALGANSPAIDCGG